MTTTLVAPRVSSVAAADAGKAIATVTLAFAADPVVRWFFPHAKSHVKYFPRILQAHAGRAFERQSVHAVEGFRGVAIWLPPGVHPDEEAMGALIDEAIPVDRQAEIFAILEQMGAGHPQEPHWYLPFLGVDPGHQRKGYGSALLSYGLRAADRDGVPAYLESTSPDNTRLYERHGFEAIGTIEIDGSTRLTRMLRQPR
jgi:ribosomal protein S18 acetylase RimI-like enzyme